MKVYVSGPMTSIPQFNFPAFDAVTELLVAAGCEVFSPADNDRRRLAEVGIDDVTKVHGFAEGNVVWYNEAVAIRTEELFRDDFNFIVNEADYIVMLPGWEKSTGARYELVLAEALSIPVVLARPTVVNAGPDETWEWELTDFDEEKVITTHLRSFATPYEVVADPKPDFRIDVPPIDNFSVRELLAEVGKRIGHSPAIAGELNRIESHLG